MVDRYFLSRPSQWVPLALMMALAGLPFVANLVGEPYYIALVARVLVYAIAASALNLALGFGGLVGGIDLGFAPCYAARDCAGVCVINDRGYNPAGGSITAYAKNDPPRRL